MSEKTPKNAVNNLWKVFIVEYKSREQRNGNRRAEESKAHRIINLEHSFNYSLDYSSKKTETMK